VPTNEILDIEPADPTVFNYPPAGFSVPPAAPPTGPLRAKIAAPVANIIWHLT
jgi:hypothetical protein